MSRNYLGRTLLIVGLLAWAAYQIYPPAGRDLALEFRTRAASSRDDQFKAIVTRLDELQKVNPDRAFANILEAVGTNDLTKYFPFYEAKQELNPTRYILNRLQREAAGKIKLGLDLQGGTSFLVGVDVASVTTNHIAGTNAPNELEMAENNQRVLAQAVEVLRRRVDKFGVSEPVIQPEGNNKILIQLPGLSQEDKERALSQIQRPAYLEFRMVHEKSDELIRNGESAPGYAELRMKQKDRQAQSDRVERVLVKKTPERGMTGKYIKSAFVNYNQVSGTPEIDFVLNDAGALLFGDITRENIGRRLAIVLDGELYSAPVIQSEIGARGQITGNFDVKEALELANVLENPLEAPVKLIESREVDPSLGKDSIQSGYRAALYGVIAVAAFMLVYYFFAGFVADLALMFNIVILLGVMCSIGTTLTLPGIAGVVLTIGMAVDANVLIFERIREELAAGKSLRGALQAGYGKAFGTIFDSNLTTLIASVLLIFMGTGSVKGFGVTLTIGVTVSMFTALVVTRLIFDVLLDKGLLKSIRMWQFPFLHGTKLDFMKVAVPAAIASWLLILIGNGYGVFVRGHGVLGVDFAGGDQQTYAFSQKVNPDRLREALTVIKVGDPVIQFQKDIMTGAENLRITTAFDSAEKVKAELQAKFPEAKFKPLSVDRVGPTVGAEITKTAVLAALLAMFGILIYVALRYEFSFAVGAVIAIVHDILMTLGWFFLSGRELSAPIVAAVLTIIGFSINDTIVIFDRIREDLKLGVRGTFREVMNQALNQTLSRTIITSGTVFLATLSLYLFGGGVVNDFAFTFLVGIITGTYSSIYIASAIVLWWHKGERPQIGSQVAMQNAASAKA
jgi:SecD/SecF fusion protein